MLKNAQKTRTRIVSNVIYAAYDAGWRTGGWMKFVSPDGTVQNSPTIMWYEAFYAIERANELRKEQA